MVDTNIKLRNAGFMSKTGQAHSYTSDIELVIYLFLFFCGLK